MAETRYAYVARSLAGSIASGRHPIGSVLPNELALAAQFGVSRATVRAALTHLQQLGLVSRKRNAGTRVEADRPVSSRGGEFGQSLGSIEDLIQYADETEREMVEIVDEVADEDLAGQLGIRPGSRLIRASHLRVHKAARRPPICWTDVFLDAAFADLRDAIPSHRGLIGSLVEARIGRRIASIRQSIRAIGIPARVADALSAETGEPSLEIRRRYLDDSGTPLLVTVSIHPADRFTYEMELSRFGPRG